MKGVMKMKKAIVRLGEYQRQETVYKITINKQTDKAIQLKITETIDPYRDGEDIDVYENTAWLPKSHIEIVDGFVIVPAWLTHEKNLPIIHIVCNLSQEELAEKMGLDLMRLTAKNRIDLLKQGHASIRRF
jgi:hypothetical protein